MQKVGPDDVAGALGKAADATRPQSKLGPQRWAVSFVARIPSGRLARRYPLRPSEHAFGVVRLRAAVGDELDVYAAPVLNFLFWGLLAIGAGSASSWDLLVSWIAAVMMLNVMAASVYIFVHDDRFSLLPYALFMDVYQSLLVNSAWVIAVVDELRGARMRWS